MQQDAETSRIAELEADNHRLRRLLDHRDAPTELRHRLRGTLALLRNVIRQSAHGRTDVAAYAAHLEDRLGSLMRVQGYIDLNGEVDLSAVIADELAFYNAHEERQIQLTGPHLSLQPRAAQALGLAIHELAVNAVEHGALAIPSSRIAVSWHVDSAGSGPAFTLVWKEAVIADLSEPTRRGFGTEVLTSLLGYELGADTSLAFEPDGLRCTIRIPFSPTVGRLVEQTT